jgi:hypothetical protein
VASAIKTDATMANERNIHFIGDPTFCQIFPDYVGVLLVEFRGIFSFLNMAELVSARLACS